MYGDWFAAKFRLRYVKNDAFHVFVTFIAIDWDLEERGAKIDEQSHAKG